jgi:hypothetical protein
MMAGEKRSWWDNCGDVTGDPEVGAIDALEDSIAPLDDETERIRRLITSFEACHHKAARWAELIVEAIGSGTTTKGPGRRPPGQTHTMETVWHHAIAALSAWCAGSPADGIKLDVGGTPAKDLVNLIGERRPLKEWQVGRVVSKIRQFDAYPRMHRDAIFRHVGLVETGTEYESIIVDHCPHYYREHAEFWTATAQTVIRDTVDDQPATISLAAAIDHLEPCHWDFVENLSIVLAAIGGDLHPKTPYASCGRNIKRTPIRDQMRVVAETLHTFTRDERTSGDVDRSTLATLGERTRVKHWLAASFEKTLRSQLDL